MNILSVLDCQLSGLLVGRQC